MKEYNQLLECLEDIVGQMQSEKITLEQAVEVIKRLHLYYEEGK